jgi:hypothetical protein
MTGTLSGTGVWPRRIAESVHGWPPEPVHPGYKIPHGICRRNFADHSLARSASTQTSGSGGTNLGKARLSRVAAFGQQFQRVHRPWPIVQSYDRSRADKAVIESSSRLVRSGAIRVCYRRLLNSLKSCESRPENRPFPSATRPELTVNQMRRQPGGRQTWTSPHFATPGPGKFHWIPRRREVGQAVTACKYGDCRDRAATVDAEVACLQTARRVFRQTIP